MQNVILNKAVVEKTTSDKAQHGGQPLSTTDIVI